MMSFVCMGKTLFRGMILGAIGHNGCMHMNKSFTLHCAISLRRNNSMPINLILFRKHTHAQKPILHFIHGAAR